jgi:hypothetical protein
MKMRLVAFLALALGFAVSAFAQQTSKPDPVCRDGFK